MLSQKHFDLLMFKLFVLVLKQWFVIQYILYHSSMDFERKFVMFSYVFCYLHFERTTWCLPVIYICAFQISPINYVFIYKHQYSYISFSFNKYIVKLMHVLVQKQNCCSKNINLCLQTACNTFPAKTKEDQTPCNKTIVLADSSHWKSLYI